MVFVCGFEGVIGFGGKENVIVLSVLVRFIVYLGFRMFQVVVFSRRESLKGILEMEIVTS